MQSIARFFRDGFRSKSSRNRLTALNAVLCLLSGLIPAAAATATFTPISGTVLLGNTPVSAMVLANGQYMFSQPADGRYDLNVPLDGNGQVVLYAFADGFAPFKAVLNPEQAREHTVGMSLPGNEPVPQLAYQLSPSDRAGWARISGTYSIGGTPICGLILSNGQYMFSCDGNLGRFDLEIPLDAQDHNTLFAFAEGFAPVTLNFSTHFSFSGTLTAAASSAADSDVNDPHAPYEPNGSFADAQLIPNPVTLGGYVNQERRGAAGRSFVTGDRNDYFRVDLTAGQTIRLQIGDIRGNDLDLFLYDADGNEVAASEGTGELEALTAPTAGAYYVRVYAWGGASNYVLTIGQSLTRADLETLQAQNDFVPGEILVKYKQKERQSLSADDFARRMNAFGLAPKAGAPDRTSLVQLEDLAPARAVSGSPAAQGKSIAALKQATLRAVKALRLDPDIAHAEPNYYRRALRVPNDTLYPDQWHYPLINLPQAWEISTGDSSVTVAVVDTGVLLNHPDLQGRLSAGYDFISDIGNAGDGDGIDANPDDPGDGGLVGSSSFHGTHVAGTIAAASDNGTGVAGVAWGVNIMPIRVLGLEGGSTYDVIQGMRFAAGLSNDSGTVPARRADIINLSLGGTGSSQTEQDTMTEIRNQGVIIIAAAGNSSKRLPFFPAGYDGVVSVSAISINKSLAPYSNYGATVDVAAPGGDSSKDVNGDGYPDGVLSTRADDSRGGSLRYTYERLNGTSMAAPHMAGVVALMKSVNPDLTPARLDTLLSSGQLTEDIGNPGRDDEFGWGMIDAYRALIAVGGTGSTDPVLVSSPASLNFGTAITEQVFALENGRGGELSIQAPVESASWLTVTPTSTNASGLGAYRATVNRDGLAAGVYSAKIAVASSANAIEIPVIMQIVDLDVGANAGRQYVLLVDPQTKRTVRQATVDAVGGIYAFSFTDIPLGEYELFSGSDHNNDLSICDAAESCGAYPTLDRPERLQVSNTLETTDFAVSFSTPLDALSADGRSTPPRTLRRLPVE